MTDALRNMHTNINTLLAMETVFFTVFIPFTIWMRIEQKRRWEDRLSEIEKRLARAEGKAGIEGK
jgi:hypothetical protein